MTLEVVIFYLFAVLTVVSAMFVVFTKNIIYAAFNLLLTFFGVAGLYVFLGADFLGIVQIIVYVGGILILLIFGVMITNKSNDVIVQNSPGKFLVSGVIICFFGGLVLTALVSTQWKTGGVSLATPPANADLKSLGKLMMNEYILIFELLGILLLVALVGAASMARKEKKA